MTVEDFIRLCRVVAETRGRHEDLLDRIPVQRYTDTVIDIMFHDEGGHYRIAKWSGHNSFRARLDPMLMSDGTAKLNDQEWTTLVPHVVSLAPIEALLL